MKKSANQTNCSTLYNFIGSGLRWLVAMAVLATASSAMAVTWEWQGGSSGNWNVPGNWSQGTVPSEQGNNDDVIIDPVNSTTPVTVTNNGAAEADRNLFLGNQAGEVNLIIEDTGGGASLTVGKDTFISNISGSTASIEQRSGTVSPGNIKIGETAGGEGEYQMLGGTLTSNSLFIGENAPGTFSFSGGNFDPANISVFENGRVETIGSGGSNSFVLRRDFFMYGANSTVAFELDAGGATVNEVRNLFLDDGSVNNGTLEVSLNGYSGSGTVELIRYQFGNSRSGEFANLDFQGFTADINYDGGVDSNTVQLENIVIIPEPSTLILVGAGLLATIFVRRRNG